MCQQHQASFVKVTIATPSLKLKEGQKSLRHGVTRQLHFPECGSRENQSRGLEHRRFRQWRQLRNSGTSPNTVQQRSLDWKSGGGQSQG
jgi:hypothetical protein